jgi:hypothetical protein
MDLLWQRWGNAQDSAFQTHQLQKARFIPMKRASAPNTLQKSRKPWQNGND